ncbi:piggyBac transposable element-derived protein 4-like [Macrobrachium rosenbergii]|uniref:piggyBac transposable element-derived protein 4-like n=1 Tax=Macrobrachium rosenbergii TaxID=79674 RepID=UPI0034D3C180
MAKQKHTYTHEELEKVMNTTGLTDLISESESESDIDELEADLLYDSDSNVEYTLIPGEDSSDDDDGEEVCGGEARDAASPEEVFSLFLNDEIVNIIVKCTNQKIDVLAPRYSRQTATYAHTEPKEIRALLGILVISGEKNDGHIPTEEMWSLDVGCSLYRVAMSEARFKFLIRCLRFVDLETREARKKDDKFAPMREVWGFFIRNCGRLYVPHENLTVDEQLLGFRGRCPFRMYIPNKPAKYGIKLVLINDSKTKYLLGDRKTRHRCNRCTKVKCPRHLYPVCGDCM